MQWSLHTNSEHWQPFQSVFLSLVVAQIEHLPWVQNCPVGSEKEIPYVKSNIRGGTKKFSELLKKLFKVFVQV